MFVAIVVLVRIALVIFNFFKEGTSQILKYKEVFKMHIIYYKN